ncbi:MAG: hypothetical protein HYX41_00020 [Bdellovibrio sp.]|nr:hypothetical protein [Bdellovibrio sp.]
MLQTEFSNGSVSPKQKERKIIVINFLQTLPVREERIEHPPLTFTVREHSVGWNFDAAESLIRTYDGYADGFAFSGIQKHLGVPGAYVHHPAYLRLMRMATKTPIYVADDLREFFTEWTLKKVLLEQPQIFFKKKVLFQVATASSSLGQIAESGAEILAADPLMISSTPVRLHGMSQIRLFAKVLTPFAGPITFNLVRPARYSRKQNHCSTLGNWIKEADIFVGFGNIIAAMESFEPFAGKILVVDHVDISTRKRLEEAGVAQIIDFVPESAVRSMPESKHFPVLAAVIDQTRIFENSQLGFSDYLLRWLEQTKVSPKPLKTSRGIKRRCAFIFHALTQKDLWTVPSTKPFRRAPKFIRDFAEDALSNLPCLYVGNLTGVVSQATGQEVECDFYGFPATPRGILAMKEEYLYKRMIQCAEQARRRGAGIIGLGAYTKVAGDAGVTIARKASIPVTNGNSYSAATTLWAARQMVERLALISPERVGNRFKAKAMIIGATGSIGRVSSLLVSLVFQELVLVATRPDKLIELREEIKRLSPETKVTVTTQSSSEIMDADLIVTATSNQRGSVLDIELVKPGAVICDCSRPLDITQEQAAKRPDVLVIESGEVILPGHPKLSFDIGLPHPSVYACTAETVLLALEGRFESFSLSKQLSLEKTKEIYKLGVKHGAKLSAVQGPAGIITDEQIDRCRSLALERLKTWQIGAAS